jgi:hypothetical protein
MKIIKFICLALGVFFATSAMALTPNTTFMVKMSTVSSTGQLMQTATTSGTSDANGKISFSFSNIPNNTMSKFLTVQIVDGSGTVVRQAMVPTSASGSNISMGVSEITDKQAKAMLKTMSDAGSDNPTQAMVIMTMVRSGAMTDADAQNFSPIARSAATSFETYMTANGVTVTQMATFKTNMLSAMTDNAAKYKESVDASTPALSAGKRGEAMTAFMDALVKAATDAGISANMMQIAFDEAGKAAESVAATSPMSADVISAMKASLRVGTQQRQIKAQMRTYSDAMTTIGASATHMQQFTAANATIGTAMTSAQMNFEQMFANSLVFPDAATINATESTMLAAMQTAFNNFLNTDAAASSNDIAGMLGTMATRMNGMGGMMSGMTSTTLANMGIGKMMTTPGGALQNWTVMMMASMNDFLTPSLTMTYTPSTTLSGQLTALGVTPPTPPTFSQFADPYKSMLEIQYDLMLVKLIDAQKLLQLGTTPTQAQLAQLKEDELAMKAAIKQNIASLTDAQKDALIVSMSAPEMM